MLDTIIKAESLLSIIFYYNLVYKVLELAGIVLNKPGLVQIATNEETSLIAQKQ